MAYWIVVDGEGDCTCCLMSSLFITCLYVFFPPQLFPCVPSPQNWALFSLFYVFCLYICLKLWCVFGHIRVFQSVSHNTLNQLNRWMTHKLFLYYTIDSNKTSLWWMTLPVPSALNKWCRSPPPFFFLLFPLCHFQKPSVSDQAHPRSFEQTAYLNVVVKCMPALYSIYPGSSNTPPPPCYQLPPPSQTQNTPRAGRQIKDKQHQTQTRRLRLLAHHKYKPSRVDLGK